MTALASSVAQGLQRLTPNRHALTAYVLATFIGLGAGILFGYMSEMRRSRREKSKVEVASIEAERIRFFVISLILIAAWARGREKPPRTAKFILLLVPRKYRENLAGDLEEEYRAVLAEFGRHKAAVWYWTQVICSILPLAWSQTKRLAGFVAVWKLIRR